MNLDQIFKNNEKWIKNRLKVQENYFKELAKGQSPELLYIGCSDSRVAAESIMGLDQGEVFVHRNIANMVINIDSNAMSVIYYAVNHLKVKDIVVCGHYACGGVKAAMQTVDLGVLNPWLSNVSDVYRLHKLELNAIKDESERYDRLVEFNVKEQCINLIKIATVQKACRHRGLKIHGWVFDLRTGKLIDLKIDFEKYLKETEEVYLLD